MESTDPLFAAGVVRAGVFEWGPKCRWERMANVTAKTGQPPQDSKERARTIMTTLRDKYDLELLVLNFEGPHSPSRPRCGVDVKASHPGAQWNLSRLSGAEGIECVLGWLDNCGSEISLWVQRIH